MQRIFEPIPIRYDGLDADQHLIEMGALAESLGGLSRILSTSAQYAATLRHVQRVDVREFRVFALTPEHPGCFNLVAVVGAVAQPAVLVPIVELAKPLYEALVAWVFAYYKKDNVTVEAMRDVCTKALEEMGATSRAALEAQTEVMKDLVDGLKDATKQAVYPINQTCTQLVLNPTAPVVGPIVVTREDKARIMEEEPSTVLGTQNYRVFLSEIDIQTKGCRVSFEGGPDERRIKGEITDPLLLVVGDPYTAAMNARAPINVLAKAVVDSKGELKRLVISDIVRDA